MCAQILAPSRRSFLKGAATAVCQVAAFGSSTMAVPKPARADGGATATMATVAAAVKIAGGIASMIARPDGTQARLSILQIQLNELIFLQLKTIDAITIISDQIEQASRDIPTLLVSDDLRKRGADISGYLARLSDLSGRAESPATWNQHEYRLLDDMVTSGWERVSDLTAHLNTHDSSGERGIQVVRQAMLALYAAYHIVPSLTAIDSALPDSAVIRNKYASSYRSILSSLADALYIFNTRYLYPQILFQSDDADAQRELLASAPFWQWSKHLETFVPDYADVEELAFSGSSYFSTFVSAAWCPGGYSDALPERRYSWAPYNAKWTGQDLKIPTDISGIGLYRNGTRAGFLQLNIALANSGIMTTHYRARPTAWLQKQLAINAVKRRSISEREGFRNSEYPTKEYYCVGPKDTDVNTFPFRNMNDSVPLLRNRLIFFEHAQMTLTVRTWYKYGLDDIARWTALALDDVMEMQNALR